MLKVNYRFFDTKENLGIDRPGEKCLLQLSIRGIAEVYGRWAYC